MSKHKAPQHDPQSLGKLSAEALDRLLQVYEIRGRRDNVLTREILTFENRENGANEWLQVNMSIIKNPLKHLAPKTTTTGWLPTPVAFEIAEAVTDMMIRMVDKLQTEGAPAQVAQALVEIADESLTKIINHINDINQQ